MPIRSADGAGGSRRSGRRVLPWRCVKQPAVLGGGYRSESLRDGGNARRGWKSRSGR